MSDDLELRQEVDGNTLGSGWKYTLPLAERLDCTETIVNQLLADSYHNPISERQVRVKLHRA